MSEVRKIVAGAIIAAFASAGAQAANTIPLGTLGVGTSTPIPQQSFAAGDLVVDTVTFWLTSNAIVNLNVSSTGQNFPDFDLTGVYGWINSFNVKLDGNSIAGPSLSQTGQFSYTDGVNPTIYIGNYFTEKFSLSPTLLSSGLHSLTITGTADLDNPAYYGGIVAVTAPPVPEPETLAMMLAGLGALAFVARRRNF